MTATTSPIAAARLFRGQALSGTCPAVFSGLSRDSRQVTRGQAYVAQSLVPNERVQHCAQARAAGAIVIAAEAPAELLTPHPRWAFARASAALHELDEHCLPLLATTGTKGKSTITQIAWWLLGAGAARTGTIGWHDGVRETPNRQTTPPADELHAFLKGLPANCPGVALEVSSHGADQYRLAGLSLAALAVTGIGHDHLDYHGSHSAYVAAKLRAVQLLRRGGRLVINADDAHAHLFAHAGACVGAEVIMLSAAEVAADGLGSPLPGAFNAWNAAAAVRLVEVVGVTRATAQARLASMPAIPGRLELLAQAPLTYVDYAHTAESIAAVITALRAAHSGAPLAIVFGCGGDRDPSKRAPMGAAASAADVVVITTDNSRSEDPQVIATEILSGVAVAGTHLVEPDRARAIVRARAAVGPAGVVVVAGKGHETTQDIRGVITPWDDRAFVRSLAPAAISFPLDQPRDLRRDQPRDLP